MDPQPKLMPVSPDAIPGALSKAERYRFLNEPWQAESICRDVLAIDPDNQPALILLVLSLTDQFDQGFNTKEALHIVGTLPNEYHRAYYSGIVHERQAIAVFRKHPDYRSRRQVYRIFQNAMDWYRKAQAIRPAHNGRRTVRTADALGALVMPLYPFVVSVSASASRPNSAWRLSNQVNFRVDPGSRALGNWANRDQLDEKRQTGFLTPAPLIRSTSTSRQLGQVTPRSGIPDR